MNFNISKNGLSSAMTKAGGRAGVVVTGLSFGNEITHNVYDMIYPV